ncbi:MAG TPA: FtsX-like permease family protein, partial [Thermoanaerobaculia bacterium]|nr:FtsX-like permease family protein [Thermoanaerobaculia bacterium]
RAAGRPCRVAIVTPLLYRSSLRYLTRHPWQIGLAVLGVALGVAVVVAVDLANASALLAFDLSTAAVTGRATHQVVPGPEGLPDDAYRRLVLAAGAPGFGAAAPVVESWVTAGGGPHGKGGRTLHLLGIDPFAEGPFRPYLSGLGGGSGSRGSGPRIDLKGFLTRPGVALIAGETARELGVAPGGRLALHAQGRAIEVTVLGTIEPRDESTRRAIADLLVVDIATAQELSGRIGLLSRIDLVVPPGRPGERVLARVRALLPPGAELLRTAQRRESTASMTRAFRLNLTALSLLALVCGAFLIYNTITFSVVQRRTLIGTLRALGVTRGQVFALVLAEATVVALAGSGAGLVAGVALGRGLVRLVTQTINDLYFVLSVRDLAIPAWTLAKGLAVGVGATLLAALGPAIEATTAPPRAVLTRSTLEARVKKALPRAAAAGVGLLALGGALLALPGGVVLAFLGLFAVILGFALLAPAATVVLMRLARQPMGALFGFLGRLAAGGVVASLSRTAVAIAALVVAVSVTVGVGVMIRSFRSTVVRWLDNSLQADLYVTAPGRGGGFAGPTLDPALADRAAVLPGVARVDRIRRAELPSPTGPVRIVAIDREVGRKRRAGILLRQGDPSRVWPAFERGAVIVSEPFARRRSVAVGSTLSLRTAAGPRPFRIVGVYYDYASDQGLVMMSRRTYIAAFHDPGLSGFSLTLAPGADADAVERALRASFSHAPGSTEGLTVQSNRAIKQASLAIFDRTFLITSVLRLLAGLVAGIGVLSALLALELERGREFAVLRANGLTPGQVWQLVTAETGLLGLTSGLLSLPVGMTLAAIMIFVVNRRSFGWTVEMETAPGVLVEAVLLALGAALLAGLYPAFRTARTSPARALREE